jgi:hypothetical protein
MTGEKAAAPAKMAAKKALPPKELSPEEQAITQAMTARKKD